MTHHFDRRTFLCRIGGLLSLAACAPSDAGVVTGEPGGAAGGAAAGSDHPGSPASAASNGRSVGGSLAPITRPILVPAAGDAVRIASPLQALPMAYVSMARRQIFVDYDFRDRASFLLDAHISVSTGVWRIRLPGDPTDQPVMPGDRLREFEELDIADWDPTMEPVEGDFRLRAGRAASVRVDFSCMPVAATGAWITAGPWEIVQCDPVGDGTCREDVMEIGMGTWRPVRGCGDPGRPVRLLAWACRV